MGKECLVMAIQDSLTGLLYSQSALKEWVTHEFNRSERYGSPFTLVRLDLPELAQMDHAARRIAFSAIAKVVKDNTRQTDLCGRVGRTKLYVLMTGTARDESGLLTERLREKLLSLKFVNKENKDFSPACYAEYSDYQKGSTSLESVLSFLSP